MKTPWNGEPTTKPLDVVSDEFVEIMQLEARNRPVMSRPPTPTATKVFIDEVRDALNLDPDAARAAADWIVAKMDRFAAWHAEPVFTMDGAGPVCSYCNTIWPLCGHHYYTGVVWPDSDDDEHDETNQP